MPEIHLHGITPVVLNPGDKVLVALREDTSREQLDAFLDLLKGRFPEV